MAEKRSTSGESGTVVTRERSGTIAKGLQKAAGAFRTISEVSKELSVPQHVLRFWETKFSQIRPMKRAGGRRYYRPEDVRILLGIREFLYDDGYTIKGVQKLIRGFSGRILSERADGKITREASDNIGNSPKKQDEAEQMSLLENSQKKVLLDLIKELEETDLILQKHLKSD